MSEQTIRLVDRLRQRLRTTIRRITLAELLFGAVLTLGAAALVWFLSAALEAGLWLASPARWVVAGVGLLLVGGLAVFFIARPALRLAGLLPGLSEEAAARRIGARYPKVADRLLNLLQLTGGRRSQAPDALVDRAVARLGQDVDPVPFEEIEDFSRARGAVRWAAIPLAGLFVFLLAAPNAFFGASERLLAPGTHFQRPAPFQLRVDPGTAALVKGDSLQITVHATGRRLPESLTLAFHHEGETRIDEISLTAYSSGAFQHTLINVRAPLRYRAEAGRVTTAWHRVTVRARPLVRRLQLTLHPPAYTERSPQRLAPNVGDVTALAGTRVGLQVTLGGPPAAHAVIAFSDSTHTPLEIDGATASGAFTLRRSGHYQLLLESAKGTSNRDPIRYTVEVQPDAPPQITLLAPESDHPLDQDLRARLVARLSDDFGFSRLRLYYRLADRRLGEAMEDFAFLELPFEKAGLLNQQIRFGWSLPQTTDLDLLPGDVVEYYLQVWDNNRVAGEQAARTAVHRLRVPSLAEKYEQLDRRQRAVEGQMETLLERETTVRQQFERLRETLRSQQTADWEDRRQLEKLQDQQQALAEGVEKMTQQIEAVSQEMQANDLVSPETMQLYQELQRVAREVSDPALQQALQQLREALQNLDLQQMQQALENFSFNEQQFRQRLERTLDLFKQLRVRQELDEAARRLGALQQQEEQLAEATRRLQEQTQAQKDEPLTDQEDARPADEQPEQAAQDRQDERADAPADSLHPGTDAERAAQTPEEQREPLAQAQERAGRTMQQLEQQLDSLAAQMRETPNAPQQAMQRLTRQLQQQQLPEQMQRNSRQLRQAQFQQAQQGQQQIQQQLARAQKGLQQMQQRMQGQQKQVNRAGLRRALSNTLRLSQQQEALHRETRDLSPQSPAVRQSARRQQQLAEDLEAVSDSLQRLAHQLPQMSRAAQQQTGEALQHMQRATGSLGQRRVTQAAMQQQGATTSLNKLSLSLARLLNRMQNGQGRGGGMSAQQMAQQLRQMAQQQGRLNSQIQQFLNDAQGTRLAANQAQRLKQLAARQQALKKQLDALRQQPGVQKEALGDLGRVAEQMEETIDELRRRQFDRPIIERQQQILSRLLQAQRSLRQRGRDRKQRRAERPENTFQRESPSELTLETEEVDQLRRALLRALETGYAPDYEALIKRYFELLRERQ